MIEFFAEHITLSYIVAYGCTALYIALAIKFIVNDLEGMTCENND